MNIGRNRQVILGALAIALISSGCANKTETTSTPGGTGASGAPITVGEYGSMTGSTATFGVDTDNGVQLAVKQINAAGGVFGHPLTIDKQDDEGKPDEALTVVKLLVSQDKVTAVLGEVASTRSIAAAPACNSASVPMISPSSTNPAVTKVGPYIFRVCFIDPFQGTAAAKFASTTLKAKKAAIMTETTSDYSTGLTKFFTDGFTKQGGSIVSTETYSAGDLDFSAQLTTIKASNPDVLYVPGYYGDIGPIAVEARKVGLTCPLLGGDGWDSPKLIEGAGGAGGALEGSYFTNHYSPTNPAPLTQKFVADYKTAYQTTPDSLAAMGYDATGVLADAMKRAGNPADGDFQSAAYRQKLRDAIATTTGYDGVTGKITIGPDRNPVKPAVVLQIKGSGYVYAGTVNP
jgi:branched-chain amino acid transport system substrate-binding protein